MSSRMAPQLTVDLHLPRLWGCGAAQSAGTAEPLLRPVWWGRAQRKLPSQKVLCVCVHVLLFMCGVCACTPPPTHTHFFLCLSSDLCLSDSPCSWQFPGDFFGVSRANWLEELHRHPRYGLRGLALGEEGWGVTAAWHVAFRQVDLTLLLPSVWFWVRGVDLFESRFFFFHF